MRARISTLSVFVFLALAPGAAPGAGVEEAGEGPYPVWWSPLLGLESLDQIDERLDRPFPAEERFIMRKYYPFQIYAEPSIDDPKFPRSDHSEVPAVPEDDREIGSCAALIAAMAEDFGSYGYDSNLGLHRAAGLCYALVALKDARPAQESFVHDFVMDAAAPDYLPAMAGRYWGCYVVNQVRAANRDGVSMRAFRWKPPRILPPGPPPEYMPVAGEPETLTVVRSIVTEAWDPTTKWDKTMAVRRLTILARGDFNGDERGDLLLHFAVIEPSLGWLPIDTALYLVSRETKDAVMQVHGAYGPLPIRAELSCPANLHHLFDPDWDGNRDRDE